MVPAYTTAQAAVLQARILVETAKAEETEAKAIYAEKQLAVGAFRLNVSTFCRIGGTFRGCSGGAYARQ
jgi:hypothetical protein